MPKLGAIGRYRARTSAQPLRTDLIADVQQADRDALERGRRRSREPFAERSLTGYQLVARGGGGCDNPPCPLLGGLLAPPPTGTSGDAQLVEVMRLEIRDPSGQAGERGGLSSGARTRQNEQHRTNLARRLRPSRASLDRSSWAKGQGMRRAYWSSGSGERSICARTLKVPLPS